MTGQFVAFVGTCALMIATPGPDTALVIRNALRGGRPGGIGTAVGVVCGQACWTLATCVGVAALLRASQPAFTAVRLAGAAYLAVLGVQALRDAVRGTGGGPPSAAVGASGPRPPRHLAPLVAVRQGVISNLGNPKSAVFFLSLLPQFVPAGHAPVAVLLALGLVYCSLTLAWLTCYGVAVAKVGDVLRRPLARRMVEAVTGVVLVGLGLRVATEPR
jgi:threonine/homoserine/homoserine lactone efflux protein